MSGPADVPAEILDRIRPVCLALPETYEEPAWVGTRWRIRKRTFAHVFSIDPDDERVFARAAAADQPVCGLTFRSTGDEIDALLSAGSPPFFKPTWSPQVVGMVLADGTDWGEVAELLAESYRLLAPKKLAARIDRPPAPPDSP
jgi:YjbR